MWGLVPSNQSYFMNMELNDFRKIRPFVKKTHVKIRIVQRIGVPFFLQKYQKRTMFFVGIFMCVILLFFLSSRIWDIHFEGNHKWTEDVLMDFLQTNGIRPSMARKKVDCGKIVKEIRKEYDDIVWVSASLDGCILKIHIKENDDTFRQKKEDSHKPQDLIATKDGVITEIITRKGTPCVHVGDQVSKGDVLVSGKIEITNDAQEVIGYRYLTADAEVYANTKMDYVDTVEKEGIQKQYNNQIRGCLYIKGWNHLLRIGTLKPSFPVFDSLSKEMSLKLGENFKLPISIGYEIIRPYVAKSYVRSKKEIQEELSTNYALFSKELEEKGVQIRKKDVKIHMYKNCASAKGILYLNEKITKKADTNVLELEGDNLDEFGRNDD